MTDFEKLLEKYEIIKGEKTYTALQITIAYELGLNADKWVSVGERLPIEGDGLDDCVNVLCLLDNETQYIYSFIKSLDTPKGRFYLSIGTIFENVTDQITHWQPLPSPPKDNNDGK